MDIEKLQQAAKAVRYTVTGEAANGLVVTNFSGIWNPGEDNAQAFSLMVAMNMTTEVDTFEKYVAVTWAGDEVVRQRYYENDPEKGAREAILNAAAWVGRQI